MDVVDGSERVGEARRLVRQRKWKRWIWLGCEEIDRNKQGTAVKKVKKCVFF